MTHQKSKSWKVLETALSHLNNIHEKTHGYHAIREKLRHNYAIQGARSFLLSDQFLSLRGRCYFIKEIKNLFLEHC